MTKIMRESCHFSCVRIKATQLLHFTSLVTVEILCKPSSNLANL